MQPISTYSRDNKLRLLFQGPPGSGKTTGACDFPLPYFIDIDVNLGGAIRYRQKRGLTLPVGYDRIDVDENGKPVANRYERFELLFNRAAVGNECDTIVIDSATGLADALMDFTNRKQPNLKDGRQLFMFFLQYGKMLMSSITRAQKHVVLIAHERVEIDEMNGGMKQFRLAWPGQLGDYLGAFFNNVWRCECSLRQDPNSKAYVQVPVFTVRTFQSGMYHGLKNDLELRPEMPIKEAIDAALATLTA